MGGYTRQMLEWVGFFAGLGVVIVGLAAFAMGRYFSRPRVAGEMGAVADRPVEDSTLADRPDEDSTMADGAVEDRVTADQSVEH